jgi:hypothetical protein
MKKKPGTKFPDIVENTKGQIDKPRLLDWEEDLQ